MNYVFKNFVKTATETALLCKLKNFSPSDIFQALESCKSITENFQKNFYFKLIIFVTMNFLKSSWMRADKSPIYKQTPGWYFNLCNLPWGNHVISPELKISKQSHTHTKHVKDPQSLLLYRTFKFEDTWFKTWENVFTNYPLLNRTTFLLEETEFREGY